jgi:osomolarity two-component system, response regulator SSK1
MQALIDFEGWRKWRGFADPLSTLKGSSHPASNGAARKTLSATPAGRRGSSSAAAPMQTSFSKSPSGKDDDHAVDYSSGSGSGEADGADLRAHATEAKNGPV